VGKSALLTRFSENVFLPSYTSTIGIDFNSRMIRVGRAICKLEIWDTAGQERFSTITANYYRGAQGALLVYDICECYLPAMCCVVLCCVVLCCVLLFVLLDDVVLVMRVWDVLFCYNHDTSQ
jgi:GTPase SAR1 family protein